MAGTTVANFKDIFSCWSTKCFKLKNKNLPDSVDNTFSCVTFEFVKNTRPFQPLERYFQPLRFYKYLSLSTIKYPPTQLHLTCVTFCVILASKKLFEANVNELIVLLTQSAVICALFIN